MNNYWHTNYKAGQGGDFLFRFALTSRAKGDAVASARFGADAASPLVAVPIEGKADGSLVAASGSLIEVAEPNVLVVSAKQADASGGLVIRLRELGGQATTAHVKLPHAKFQKATACNLVEDPEGPLEVRDGAIAVPVRGLGLATVLVE
jgi:alpha-mannosidase